MRIPIPKSEGTKRARADWLWDNLDTTHADLMAVRERAREAEERIAAMEQAEAERKTKGLLARLRVAWRGE